jgi:transposase-like protein
MEDYPQNQSEFDSRFATEQGCREYLFRLRWPDGFVCPACGARGGWLTKRGLVMCRKCGRQVSLTAGTVFAGSRKPLHTWFRAAWALTTDKAGASALAVQRVLGLGSYQTAWTWLHKLRRAMVRPDQDRLSGRIEVDETYFGGRSEGHEGRRRGNKTLIVIAAQEDKRKIGRIRMQRVPDASAKSLRAFIRRSVEPGAVVHTDGWFGYMGLKDLGYIHESTPQERLDIPGAEEDLLPRVHRVASLLKRWVMGTHQGAVSHRHLDYYLDEFTFRFNRRTSASRGKIFYRLLQNAVRVPPAPYRSLVQERTETKEQKHNP